MNWRMFRRCRIQCLLLAWPGVAIVAVLTAAFVKFVLPYEWDWGLAFSLGALLSITDPAAVMALLNSLDASPTLGAILGGESLLNDASAVLMLHAAYNVHSGQVQPVASLAHAAPLNPPVARC